jgi:predicted phage terminase large subunit-like protein
MGCQSCEALGRTHEDVKNLILQSPRMTGIVICGFDWLKNSKLHYALDRWFTQSLVSGRRRFLAMTPRDHMKTTYFAISYMVNLILNDPEVRILYRMASATEAQKTLNSIINILSSSENLKHFFPDRVLNPRADGVICRADMLRIQRQGIYREGTIEARGIDSSITGGHFTHQIYDDVIDETMVDSDTTQNTVVNRLKRSDSLFVNPSEDVELIIGTRWPGLFYRWLLEDSGIVDEYESVVLGCYVDDRLHGLMKKAGVEDDYVDGSPIWPEHFSMDALTAIERKSPFDFTHQWLNLEVEEGARRFNREDFMFYRAEDGACIVNMSGKEYCVPISSLYITMTVDPATGEHDKTDQSAITVCGFDRATGLIFVLDVWQARALPHDLINQIIDMAKRWRPHVVAPEDVSFQKTLKHFLRQEMIQRGVHFHIQPVKPGIKSKGSRILDALQPFVANHQVYVLRSHSSSLVSEMVALQVVGGKVVGRSPNLADSLSYHAEFWRGQERQRGQDEDDESKIRMWAPLSGPAYGIECLT